MNACSEGVSIGYEGPRTYREYPNWPSTYEHADAVIASINKDLARGMKAGPFSSPPFNTFVGSPMGCFQRKRSSKFRVIHDLSYPPSLAINEFIDIANYKMRYLSLDDVVYRIKRCGHGTLLAKLDLEDAFKSIPVREQDWPLLGSTFIMFNPDTQAFEKQYFYDKVLQFGCRSSPKLFSDFARAANLVMKNRGVTYSDQYLDDFITMGAADSPECKCNLDIMMAACKDLGFSLNPKKIVQPTTCLEFLGIILDTEAMEMRISDERLNDIIQELLQWQCKCKVTKRQLLSLIGKLIFVCRVVRAGRTFLQHLIELAKTAKCLHHKITLTPPAQLDIAWWIAFLPTWNKKSVFFEEAWISDEVLHIYTDASNMALSGYFNGDWFVLPFTGQFTPLLLQSINWRELCAILLAAATWGSKWQGQRILLHCDNMCVVECLNHGSSRSPELMQLIRKLFFVCAHYGFEVSAVYVNTKCNDVADALSRLQFKRFFECAPHAASVMTPPYVPVLF